MKNAAITMILAGLITAPVQAANWSESRSGAFVGARLTIGGKTGGRPLAALTLAPTQNRIAGNGMTSMKIGEGIAFGLTPGAKPSLTLAGMRADMALGLTSRTTTSGGKKLGMSDGGKVALGLGIAAVIAGGLYLAADHIAYCDEGECD
jgi:hypothetical protein